MKNSIIVEVYDKTFEGYKQNVRIHESFFTSFKDVCKEFHLNYHTLKMKAFPLETEIKSQLVPAANVVRCVKIYKLKKYVSN